MFDNLYKSDLRRYPNGINPTVKRFLFFFRKCQTSRNKLLQSYYRWRLKRIKKLRGLEIFYNTKIGSGLYLGHAYNITINSKVVIGRNCNIHKGVTIGQENRGQRKGAPIIGDKVWIGVNSTIVGKIIIGNDVLIAPNTFVNCNVPSHSIVFGNPCIIKQCANATEGYINNIS